MRSVKTILLCLFVSLLSLGMGSAIVADDPSQGLSYDEVIYPKGLQKFVILKPTGITKNGISVLEVFSGDAQNKKIVEELFEKSFMKESVKLYFLVQNYLINHGTLKAYEPAYLLLSNEQGGFPRFGFYLKEGKDNLDKRDVPYIELVKNNSREENTFGSMTQNYPHEMGHILYQMLSEITKFNFPHSTDVHCCICFPSNSLFPPGRFYSHDDRNVREKR